MNKCKNCGAELKPGIKFCTKCGAPIEDSNMSESVSRSNNVKPTRTTRSDPNNETIEKLKKHSLNYFDWYKNSIKNPTNVDNENKYNGLITLLLNAILVAYSFYIVINKLLTAAKTEVSQSADAFGLGSAVKLDLPTGFPLYLRIFFVAVLYYVIFLLVGFACKKYLINKKETVFDYSNQLGSYSSSLVILQLVVALFLLISIPTDINSISSVSVLGSFQFLMVLIVIITNVWNVAYTASIIMDNVKTHLDKIYVGVITLLANNIVLYLIFKIVLNSATSKYTEIFKELMR